MGIAAVVKDRLAVNLQTFTSRFKPATIMGLWPHYFSVRLSGYGFLHHRLAQRNVSSSKFYRQYLEPLTLLAISLLTKTWN